MVMHRRHFLFCCGHCGHNDLFIFVQFQVQQVPSGVRAGCHGRMMEEGFEICGELHERVIGCD